MRKAKILPVLFITILTTVLTAVSLSGCSSSPKSAADGQLWQEDWISIGRNIGIEAPKQLKLLENKEILAADGLYYATWVDGDCVPYENSEGETVDLYDAQLYFLAAETPDEDSARADCETWLAAAEENYDVQSEEKITCSGQEYTAITYNCVSDTTPYDHGVSVFGTSKNNAVCIEFTCLADYDKDLKPILNEFLNGCHYRAE